MTRERIPFMDRAWVLLPIFLMFSHPGFAATYFVSPLGDNNQPGSAAQPWKTVQKAADTMASGDSCIVWPGDYDENILISTSGGPGDEISFISGQDTVTVNSFNVSSDYIRIEGFKIHAEECNGTWGYGVKLSSDHCVIENNFLYYCPKGGIVLTASADHNTITNNECSRNGLCGIYVDGTFNTCEFNEVYGTIVRHIPTDCTNEDADGIRFFGTGHVFRGNYIHSIDYSGDNEGYSPHIDGFQTYWWSGVQDSAQSCTFEYNLIDLPYYKGEGATAKGWEIEDARDLLIRYNIVRADWGIRNEASNTRIYNNTFSGITGFTEGWQSGVRLHDAPACSVLNNIIVDFDDVATEVTGESGGSVLDYNCTHLWDGRSPGGDPGPHDLWNVDPLLTDPSQNDFGLSPGSPCADSGRDLGISHSSGLHPGSSWPDGVTTIGQYSRGSGWEMGAFISVSVPQDTIPPVPPSGLEVREGSP